MTLLDTHALIWWLQQPDKLSKKALEVIEDAFSQRELAVSSISYWEMALLVKKGTIELAPDPVTWFSNNKKLALFQIIAIDADIAIQSTLLPSIHADPADRFIISTAMIHHSPLVSKDAIIKKYPYIQVIW